MNILIVVTHLLGTGHLSRALTLARAFSAQGHKATLVSGGMPVAHFNYSGVTMVQLPPLRSDGVDFTRLLTADGTSACNAYLGDRRAKLVETLTRTKPDVVITELYPFGRRVLRTEFLALLAALNILNPRPVTLASIRDILAPPSKPERARVTDDIVAQFYDGVLVHSDQRSTPLEQSWPVSDQLRPKLFYTGYVAAPPAGQHPKESGKSEILVSAGGGSVGDGLFECAVMAAQLNNGQIWRLLVGGSNADARIARLKSGVNDPRIIVERARPDFRQMLNHAACSVSMSGYNTALDILQSGVASVLIPFDDGGEVEQRLRAQSLAKMAGIEMIISADLTAEHLLVQVARARKEPRAAGAGLDMNGANETVRIAENLAQVRS